MTDQLPSDPPSWKEWQKHHRSLAWLLSPEWASEWIVHWSRSWDFVKVLELGGKLAVVFVAGTWLIEGDDREKARQDAVKAKHYRAWELINSAKGTGGDGGRRYALEDLFRDRVSLSGAPLTKAYLPALKMPGADLSKADLTEADLSETDFTGANLYKANLSKAILIRANLQSAHISMADLSNSDLTGADLSGASLIGSRLIGAMHSIGPERADMSKVSMTAANLSGAELTLCKFSGGPFASHRWARSGATSRKFR